MCLGDGLLGHESVHGWRKFPTTAGKLPGLTASLRHGHLKGVWLPPWSFGASEASVPGGWGKLRGLSWLGLYHTEAVRTYTSREAGTGPAHTRGGTEELWNCEMFMVLLKKTLRKAGGRGCPGPIAASVCVGVHGSCCQRGIWIPRF